MRGTVLDREVTDSSERDKQMAPARRSAVARGRKILASCLLIAVLAVAGLVVSALYSGRWMASPVLSGSMRPGFGVGGLVIGERVPLKSLSVRDVIVFKNPDNGEQMVHRIIWLKPEGPGAIGIKTQGDANSAADPWTVTINQPTIYRIRWSVPLVGYLVVAFQNHRGFVLLAAGLVLILVGAGSLTDRTRKKAEEPVVPTDDPPAITIED